MGLGAAVVFGGLVLVLAPACAGRIEGQRAEGEEGYVVFDSVIPGGASGAFEFDSLTTTDLDVSARQGSINWATIEATAPGQNLAFLQEIEGYAQRGDKRKLASFEGGGKPVVEVTLQVTYKGDIVPYFRDGTHLEMHWKGRIAGVVPKGGVAIRCRVGLKT